MGRRGKTNKAIDEDDDEIERMYINRSINRKRIRDNTGHTEHTEDSEEKREKKRLKKERQKEKKMARKEKEEKEKKEREEEKNKLQERADKKKERKKKERERAKEKKREREGGAGGGGGGGGGGGEWKEMNLGIKYKDLQIGKGEVIEDRTRIRVSYVGKRDDENGKVFDRSSDFSFKFGKGDVIKGWDMGLRGIRKGGTRLIKVPPKAGYGTRDLGWGGSAHLWFKVTVL
jgi:FKBP-type peptidyl-prolyl cis-trans isomerase